MDIKRLEVFSKVIELKSFTRAAEALGLSQPTVSEHVRMLEKAVDEKLVDRLGREALPTPAGRILYKYALKMARLRDEALQALAQYRGSLSGELILGASTIPGAYILPKKIATFAKEFPEVRVRIQIAGTGKVLNLLLAGELELAVVGADSSDQRLEFTPLYADELQLVVPAGHRWAGKTIAPKELTEEPFIARESGSATRQVLENALREQSCDPDDLRTIAEMGSVEAVRQAVRSGLGVAVLSRLALHEDVERGLIATAEISGIQMKRSFHLASRKGREMSPVAAAFVAHLQE